MKIKKYQILFQGYIIFIRNLLETRESCSKKYTELSTFILDIVKKINFSNLNNQELNLIFLKINQYCCKENTFYNGKNCQKCPDTAQCLDGKIICQENKYFNTSTYTCVDKCPEDMIEYEGKCYSDCNQIQTYEAKITYSVKDSNKCIDSCPTNVPYVNTENNNCVSNCPGVMKEYEGKCYYDCNQTNDVLRKITYSVEGSNKCFDSCPTNVPYIHNNNCVESCPSPYTLAGNICTITRIKPRK